MWETGRLIHNPTFVHTETSDLAHPRSRNLRCGEQVAELVDGSGLTERASAPSPRASTSLPERGRVIHPRFHSVDSRFQSVGADS